MAALSSTNFASNESTSNTRRPSRVMTLTSRKLMELPLDVSRLFKQHSSQFGIWAMSGWALGIDKVFRSFFHYQGDSQATLSDTERNDRTLEAWTETLERISRAWKFAAVASAFLFPSSIGLMAIECVLRTRVALVCAIAALLFSVASLTSSFLLATMRPTLQSAQISNLWVEASTNYVQTLSVIEFWTALAFPVWSVAWCIILITTTPTGDLVLIHGFVLHKSERNTKPHTQFAYTFDMIKSPPYTNYDENNSLQPAKEMPFSKILPPGEINNVPQTVFASA
ncbi:unnamed protein product [Cyclocybe aegerita]|uniref:Uncharacterized protein n=1 Tax=Cyclocybe aegerita TaxID=1973307 RepID=A0A8S0WKA5_CYCAE|nr:unnamed protein product [Cyclocybe aegerita]